MSKSEISRVWSDSSFGAGKISLKSELIVLGAKVLYMCFRQFHRIKKHIARLKLDFLRVVKLAK